MSVKGEFAGSSYYMNNDEVKEDNKRLSINTMLYPIAKSYFENYHDYDDLISTYDYSLDNIGNMINEKIPVVETIQIKGTDDYIQYKMWFSNVRICPPNSDESKNFSLLGWVPTPNMALAKMSTYAATVLADAHIELETFNKADVTRHTQLCEPIIIQNGYRFNIPIPVFSKYCSLRCFDYNTLIKSGEEMEAMYGYFIVGGKIRYLIPITKKPFNSPIVFKNDYDDQISRTECLYTKGFEYEDSYQIIASLIKDKSKNIGRGGTVASIPDYIFSLQMNDKIMNRIIASPNAPTSVKKELINAVPIRYLFYAFGCKNDLDIIKFICPAMDDFALIHSIRNSCLQGAKHKEALTIANIGYKLTNGVIVLDEPLTQDLALYIIGQIILTKEKKDSISKFNSKLYRANIITVTKRLLNQKFIPGIGSGIDIDRNEAVCVELGNIIRRLYLVGFQLEPSQSKQSLCNKRLRIGQQIEREFKAFHNARVRDDVMINVRKIINDNKYDNIVKHLRDQLPSLLTVMGNAVSNSLNKSFKETNPQSKLKTNMITPKNINFIHGSLRELVISNEIKGASVSWENRDAHQSELFFIDPTQTPESGSQTGRFKMPSLYTFVTLATEMDLEIKFLQNHKHYMKRIEKSNVYNIKCNGSIVGYCEAFDKVEELYADLMEARRKHVIHDTTTITLNHSLGVLSIWCDIGRLATYFVNVNNSFNLKTDAKTKQTTIEPKPEFEAFLKDCSENVGVFNKGIDTGFLELYDSEMTTYNALVAPSVKEFYEKPLMYSHIALPNAIHGVVSGMVPGINMCKGVRCALITNHTKQAIGPNLRYPQLKYQGDATILASPQMPLAKTCVYNYKKVGETPYGQNVTCAFMIYKYNQEDSIIVNGASAESGNFLEIDSMFTKMDKIEQDQEFKIPKNCVLNGNPDSYAKLDENTSLPKRVGLRFFTGDALIGKVTKIPNSNDISDYSILNTRPDGRIPRTANIRTIRSIVKNYIHDRDKGAKLANFGQFCVPIVGDKVNTECAQKGTIGRIVPPSDMPYTTSGLRPDVIFNPPSIFKRETYSQIYLAMVMKVAALTGCSIDCTPYHTQRTTEEIKELAKQLGINDMGKEVLYDPSTGRRYRCHIFVGNHYYERQPHLVDKKMNIRNGGPKDPITRMPTKGLKRGGGQSIDRMGSDSMMSSGIHSMRFDEFLNRSSKIRIGVCKHCNSIKSYYNKNKNAWCCPNCGYHPDFEIKYVPHASNIINQIFQALHISIDYFQDGNINDDYKQFTNSE